MLPAIILFALVLRLFYFIGHLYWEPDPFIYWHNADAICRIRSIGDLAGYIKAADNFAPPHFYHRYTIVFPVAAIFAIFGMSEFTGVLWGLICSVGEIAVIYLLGQKMFSRQVGLTAAALLSFYPLQVYYSTILSSDPILSFFVSLTVLFFLMGLDSKSKLAGIYYILSGLGLWAVFVTKAYGVLILPVLGTMVLIYKPARKLYWLALLSFVVILGLNEIFEYWMTGEFFYAWKALRVLQSWHGRALIYYLPYFFPIFNQNTLFNESGLFPYVAFPLLFFYFFRPKKNLLPIMTWLLLFYLYLEFGSLELTQYKLVNKYPRFMLVVTGPVILFIAYYLVELWQGTGDLLGKLSKRGREVIVMAVMLGLMSTSVWENYLLYGSMQDSFNREHRHIAQIGEYLRQSAPGKEVYIPASYQWKWRLPYYLGFDSGYRINEMKDFRLLSSIRQAYVILDREVLEKEKINFSLDDIPLNWRLLKVSKQTALYYAV